MWPSHNERAGHHPPAKEDVWDHLNYYHTFREACRHVEQVPDQWQAAYRVRVTFILRFNYSRE